MRKAIFLFSFILLMLSCNRNKFNHDASGIFEATEIIISSEASGRIEKLNITEGDVLAANQYIGYIDTTQLYLQKLQLQATSKAVNARQSDIVVQIAAIKEQIADAKKNKTRIENMLKDGAATQKQLDDINSRLNVLERQLAAQMNTLTTSNSSLDKESAAYEIQVAQIEDRIRKSYIVNPIDGTVLNKYVEESEYATPGKPLYKIADTKHLFLRAYVVSNQLNEIQTGQEVVVYINDANGNPKSYKGVVSWISDKAEFTPKTIQTKDERQNLVYAVKIAVENTDGAIKIGMYGDVDFKHKQQ